MLLEAIFETLIEDFEPMIGKAVLLIWLYFRFAPEVLEVPEEVDQNTRCVNYLEYYDEE